MSEATEKFWGGTFGDEYTRRNEGMVGRNISFFARALYRAHSIRSVLEFGCGTGQNIAALKSLHAIEAHGIELNAEAAMLAATCADKIYRQPVREWRRPDGCHWDLVLSKGFLIHIPPEELSDVYAKMFEASNRYILLAEYYNPSPVEIVYRGETGKLWKRDFATDLIGRFPTLRVVDYGFIWRHDYPWQQDDITYFLLEKR